MPIEPTQQSKVKIEAYSLAEFCKLTQQAINQGYEFDFETNEHFPQSYGSLMEATMLLKVIPVSELSTKLDQKQYNPVQDQTIEVKPKPLGRPKNA